MLRFIHVILLFLFILGLAIGDQPEDESQHLFPQEDPDTDPFSLFSNSLGTKQEENIPKAALGLFPSSFGVDKQQGEKDAEHHNQEPDSKTTVPQPDGKIDPFDLFPISSGTKENGSKENSARNSDSGAVITQPQTLQNRNDPPGMLDTSQSKLDAIRIFKSNGAPALTENEEIFSKPRKDSPNTQQETQEHDLKGHQLDDDLKPNDLPPAPAKSHNALPASLDEKTKMIVENQENSKPDINLDDENIGEQLEPKHDSKPAIESDTVRHEAPSALDSIFEQADKQMSNQEQQQSNIIPSQGIYSPPKKQVDIPQSDPIESIFKPQDSGVLPASNQNEPTPQSNGQLSGGETIQSGGDKMKQPGQQRNQQPDPQILGLQSTLFGSNLVLGSNLVQDIIKQNNDQDIQKQPHDSGVFPASNQNEPTPQSNGQLSGGETIQSGGDKIKQPGQQGNQQPDPQILGLQSTLFGSNLVQDIFKQNNDQDIQKQPQSLNTDLNLKHLGNNSLLERKQEFLPGQTDPKLDMVKDKNQQLSNGDNHEQGVPDDAYNIFRKTAASNIPVTPDNDNENKNMNSQVSKDEFISQTGMKNMVENGESLFKSDSLNAGKPQLSNVKQDDEVSNLGKITEAQGTAGIKSDKEANSIRDSVFKQEAENRISNQDQQQSSDSIPNGDIFAASNKQTDISQSEPKVENKTPLGNQVETTDQYNQEKYGKDTIFQPVEENVDEGNEMNHGSLNFNDAGEEEEEDYDKGFKNADIDGDGEDDVDISNQLSKNDNANIQSPLNPVNGEDEDTPDYSDDDEDAYDDDDEYDDKDDDGDDEYNDNDDDDDDYNDDDYDSKYSNAGDDNYDDDDEYDSNDNGDDYNDDKDSDNTNNLEDDGSDDNNRNKGPGVDGDDVNNDFDEDGDDDDDYYTTNAPYDEYSTTGGYTTNAPYDEYSSTGGYYDSYSEDDDDDGDTDHTVGEEEDENDWYHDPDKNSNEDDQENDYGDYDHVDENDPYGDDDKDDDVNAHDDENLDEMWARFESREKDTENDNNDDDVFKDGDNDQYDHERFPSEDHNQMDDEVEDTKPPTAPTNMVLFYTWMILAILVMVIVVSTYQAKCKGLLSNGNRQQTRGGEDRKRLLDHEYV